MGNLTEIAANETERAHLVFGSREIDVGVFHTAVVTRERPVEIYCFVGGAWFSIYSDAFGVLCDGVIEIDGDSKIFVNQIARMLDGIVGLVGDDEVVAVSEPRCDGVFATAGCECKNRTEEQKDMFHKEECA